nr:hypothetical protein CFP56_63948 [Quercus suber]
MIVTVVRIQEQPGRVGVMVQGRHSGHTYLYLHVDGRLPTLTYLVRLGAYTSTDHSRMKEGLTTTPSIILPQIGHQTGVVVDRQYRHVVTMANPAWASSTLPQTLHASPFRDKRVNVMQDSDLSLSSGQPYLRNSGVTSCWMPFRSQEADHRCKILSAAYEQKDATSHYFPWPTVKHGMEEIRYLYPLYVVRAEFRPAGSSCDGDHRDSGNYALFTVNADNT